MKVNIVYDDEGKIHAISHPSLRKDGSTILGRFDPLPGQYSATVDVPAELDRLKPRELHDSVRLEHRDGSPHLVHKH
jgi:hypothetical protein